MAAAAVMAVAVAPRMSGAVVVAVAVDATAVMAAIAAAPAAVARASFLAAAAAAAGVVEVIGAGLTACGPGVLITGAISPAHVPLAAAQCAVRRGLKSFQLFRMRITVPAIRTTPATFGGNYNYKRR